MLSRVKWIGLDWEDFVFITSYNDFYEFVRNLPSLLD